MKKLVDFAKENDLLVVETVERYSNSHATKFALTGFYDFEDAETIQRMCGGTLIKLHQDCGDIVYERCEKVYECLKISSDLYGDDFLIISKDDYYNVEEFTRDLIMPRLDDLASCIEDVVDCIKKGEEIWNEIECIKERNATMKEGVVLQNSRTGWEYYDTIDVDCMCYEYDGHTYKIGLVIEDDNELLK